MHTKEHGERPICKCVTQGCKQVGVEFFAPIREIVLVPVKFH